MKKILAYTLVAVLLGVVTMQAPFALFVSEMDTQAGRSRPYISTPDYMQKAPPKTEKAYGITPVTHSTDTVFILFLSVFSFVIALGVMSYFKRKTFSSSFP